MLLTKDRSLCDGHAGIIVSRDKGSKREHRAINQKKGYEVRQYKLDGDVVSNQKCCDFLLLNDTLKHAYFIELKGNHIEEAVPQLEAGERQCRAELQGYKLLYRIICSKVNVHNVQKNSFRRFKDKCGSRLIYRTGYMEEEL